MELTRSEKYVHNFVLNIELAKERKNQAANVIKVAFIVWYLKQKQRRLVQSIYFHQQLRHEQRNLFDNCVDLPELLTIQRETSATTQATAQRVMIMTLKVDQIEETS